MCFYLMEALFPQSIKKRGSWPLSLHVLHVHWAGFSCRCSRLLLQPKAIRVRWRGNSPVPVGLSICITSCDRLWTCQEKRVACLLPSACWEKGLLSRCAPNKLSGLENGCMLLYDAFPDLVLLYFSLCFIIYVSFDFQSTPSPELFFFFKALDE